MSTVLDRPPERVDRGTAPPLIHLEDRNNKGTTLCGIPVTKRHPDGRHAQCVVCVDMNGGRSRPGTGRAS